MAKYSSHRDLSIRFSSLVLLMLTFTPSLHDDQPHQHVAMATTYPSVLVATISSSVVDDVPSFNLNLPVGTPAQKVPLKLDLQSPFTTLRCSTLNSSSGSFQPSLSSTFSTQYACNGAAAPPSSQLSPAPYPSPTSKCSCAQDTLSLYIERTAFGDPLLFSNVSAVNFTCCTELDSTGVAGFSKGDKSLPAQISKSAGLARQFSYCLPSIAFFGRVTEYARLYGRAGRMEGVAGTTLPTRLYYVKGGGYAFKLYNISMRGSGSGVLRKPIKMRISTTQTFTTLDRSVYKAFRQSFRDAIGYRTVVKAVRAMEPFDTCFDTSPLFYAGQAPFLKAPTMSFEVEGGGGWGLSPRSTFVYNGSNSMVACMGILKASAGQPYSVLGTFQQLDCLAEFDLEKSRFGFRSIFSPDVYNPDSAVRCGDLVYPMYPN